MNSESDYKAFFKDKKITVMGLGLLGRGVGDAAFLAECGADLIVTDLKTKAELESSLKELAAYENIKFVLGGHRLEDFKNRDMILKAAGVPIDSVFIAEARKNNIPVEMSSALFARFTPATVVGITGTRGKSTVTHLLYDVLKRSFSPSTSLGIKKPAVFLGGNVKGVSTLQFLSKAKAGDVAVLELDSWQLQGFGEARLSPHIAIFTNFLDDHQNYYKGNTDQYLDDKANIFKNQTKADFLIMGSDVAELIYSKYKDIQSTTTVTHMSHVPSDWQIQIPGLHNKYNTALVIEAAKILGIDIKDIQKAVEDFKGVPGRLEFLKEIGGVKIYNDTTATTADALIAALEALGDERKNIVLIMGGADKNLDMHRAFEAAERFCKKIILLPGTGTDKILKENPEIFNNLKEKREEVTSMQQAVKLAMKSAEKDEIVLLSPGFASFGLFKNEFDREEKFLEAVKNL